MAKHENSPGIPLPPGWPRRVKSATLNVIALAQYAAAYPRSWAINGRIARVRLKAENDQLRQEVALLTQEIRIKDARMKRVDSQKRPHCVPTERMAILEFRTARAWSAQQTAETFLVTATTIASWMKRVDDEGANALVQIREPVNKFPDFVRYAVQRLKALCPSLGKAKIAEMLCRAGLHLGTTTVVGQHGSIAAIERFIRSMKDEGTRRILVPQRRRRFGQALAHYFAWYNAWRPHAALEGRTPNEVCFRLRPANRRPRLEPRRRWPRSSPCAGLRTLIAGQPGDRFTLEVDSHGGARHLPVFLLKRAA